MAVRTVEVCAYLAACLAVFAVLMLREIGRDRSIQQKAFLARNKQRRFLQAVRDNVSASNVRASFFEGASHSARFALSNSVLVERNSEKTVLFLAALNRSPDMVKLLLLHGANVTAGRVDEGTTPLHVAAGWRHSAAIVEALLAARDRDGVIASARAKPRLGGLRGHSPLFWAAHYGRTDTFRRIEAWMLDVGWQYVASEDSFVPDQNLPAGPESPSVHEQEGEEREQREEQREEQRKERDDEPLPKGALTPIDAIAALDDAGSGAVALAHVGTLMRLVGANPTEAQVEAVRQQLVRRGVQAVTPQTLEGVLAEWRVHADPPEDETQDLLQAWGVFDADGNGILEGDELLQLEKTLTTLGEPLQQAEFAELIHSLDADRDGRITRDELMQLLT